MWEAIVIKNALTQLQTTNVNPTAQAIQESHNAMKNHQGPAQEHVTKQEKHSLLIHAQIHV